MLILPHQASGLMLWINLAGGALAAALVFQELRRQQPGKQVAAWPRGDL
jgi:hypothetical protein